MQAGSSKAATLRAALAERRLVRAVGSHDGLTAKLVEEAGFEAVWASSFETSASHGVPDASLITMTQFLDAAETMNMSVSIPVIADCDTGFGGPMNVAYTVRRYERRGISAICIEDKLFPKINSFAEAAQDLLPAKDFAEKIDAGKQAQIDSDFLLIARTEALISGLGVDEALERANIYADAGADLILVHSKSSRADQVLAFGAAWNRDIPLVAVPTTYPQVRESELSAAGYGIVIYANQGLRAAIAGMRNALHRLCQAGRAEELEAAITPMADVFALQDMPAAYKVSP